ncbi:MAG: hypothetical protein K6F35_12740 [Lachnospiraceae bacterium]|nr:hypothetical protein [Lachnospiraceae bacterium]
MTAKEYLNQAYRIDQRINAKLEQIHALRDMLTKTGAAISDMPKNPNRGESRMENRMAKILDMEAQIDDDVDMLVSLKKDIMGIIREVEPVDCQMLLELRYLCFKTWEEIADELNCTVRNVHNLHSKALGLVRVP